MNMYLDKKPVLKTNRPIFLMGMASFFATLGVGRVLMDQYPSIYQIFLIGVLITILLGVVYLIRGIVNQSGNRQIDFLKGFFSGFLLSILLEGIYMAFTILASLFSEG